MDENGGKAPMSWWVVFSPSWATDFIVALLALYLLRFRPRSLRSGRTVEAYVVDTYHLCSALLGAAFKALLAYTFETGIHMPIWLLFGYLRYGAAACEQHMYAARLVVQLAFARTQPCLH